MKGIAAALGLLAIATPALAEDEPPVEVLEIPAVGEPPPRIYGAWLDGSFGVSFIGEGGRGAGVTLNGRRGRLLGALHFQHSQETGNGYHFPSERSSSVGVLVGAVETGGGWGVFSIAAGPAISRTVERGTLDHTESVGCGSIFFAGLDFDDCHTEYFYERMEHTEPALTGVASALVRGPFCLPESVALGVAMHAALRPRGHTEAVLLTFSVGVP